VFNHTGESDAEGPTLSLRGLDPAYYRRGPDGALVNDTGCGNTLDCAHPATRRLVIDALRHFVAHAGVDGFRFDLAPVMGRDADGFDPDAPLLRGIAADPMLSDRVLIAEPWDIGPGGYRLGGFRAPFLEWNDRARDGIRAFWRGDAGAAGPLATALAGSDDVFAPPVTRSVNFVAAHDGMTLADVTAYERKDNHANGEENRDGHDHNISWNHGVEGPTDDPEILAARDRDRRALLGTLFASRGSIMLTAGDEFGRSQGGNNNAYAQDNATTWLDWARRDTGLEAQCAALSALRRDWPELGDPGSLTGAETAEGVPDVAWLRPDGAAMGVADWEAPDAVGFAMVIAAARGRLAVLLNRGGEDLRFALTGRPGFRWTVGAPLVGARCVEFAHETRDPQ
jgi:glycogen operon protein